MRPLALIIAAALAIPGVVQAQTAGPSSTQGPIPVHGNVLTLCTLGTLSSEDNIFDLGIITDPATGLLTPGIRPPSKILEGAICNAQSVITVHAEPLVAQGFVEAAPSGFAKAVDFTATAAGWTDQPAVFDTRLSENAGANQQRGEPFAGQIVLSLGDFSTVGGNQLALVADPDYRGVVVVTLAVAD